MSDLAKRIREQAGGVLGPHNWDLSFNVEPDYLPTLLYVSSPWQNYNWFSALGKPQRFRAKVKNPDKSYTPREHLEIFHYKLREAGLRKTFERKFRGDTYMFEINPDGNPPPVPAGQQIQELKDMYGKKISVVFSTISGDSPIVGPQQLMQEFMDECKQGPTRYQDIVTQILGEELYSAKNRPKRFVHLYDLISKPTVIHFGDLRE